MILSPLPRVPRGGGDGIEQPFMSDVHYYEVFPRQDPPVSVGETPLSVPSQEIFIRHMPDADANTIEKSVFRFAEEQIAQFDGSIVRPPRAGDSIVYDVHSFVQDSLAFDFDMPQVRWLRMSEEHGSNLSFSSLDGHINIPGWHNTVTSKSRARQLAYFLVDMMVLASGESTQKTIVISKKNEGETMIDIRAGDLGMLTHRIQKQQGEVKSGLVGGFFELALRAEIGARWNEHSNQPTLQKGSINNEQGEAMPSRYYSLDIEPNVPLPLDSFNVQAVSLDGSEAAYGLNMLSSHLKKDLFSYIIDARQPEYETQARRGLIKSINSIDPHLYKKLRDLAGTTDGSLEGLRLIKEAIWADGQKAADEKAAANQAATE